jgi:exopolysaccharide biosynthesis polyprenyl glycosylphosphotransferase
MYQREGLIFKVLLGAFDVLALSVAFWVAYAVRFGSPELLPYDHLPELADSVVTCVLCLFSFLLVFRARGLYAPRAPRPLFQEISEILASALLAFVVLIALNYFMREDRYSRLTLGFFGVFAVILLGFGRARAREAIRSFVRRRLPPHRVVIFGAAELAAKVAGALLDHPELGLEVVGFLGSGAGPLPRPLLGSYEEAPEVIRRFHVDQVIYAIPHEENARLPELLDLAAREAVDIKVVPDLYRYVTLCAGVEEFAGLPIVRIQGTPMTGFDRFVKRGFDIAAAAILLIVSSPLILIVALAVKLTSRGPVLYRQERMGLDGHLFKILKFRTMVPEAERETGEVWSGPDDPRCTAAGSWLRRLSLDEMPQLVNVLRGDMSLVGPRPERPVFIEQFRAKVPRYHLRHMVKAGITGWAQVHGWRGRTSLEKRLEYDLYYIENWSFALDLKILARTLLGGFFNRGN